MLIVITGGSASGKSAHAEDMICRYAPASRLYLATMEPFGAEARARIARHHALRQGKGFETVEWYRDLPALNLGKRYHGILLECMSNLLANEMFAPQGCREDAVPGILQGVKKLEAACSCLVVVTNEIFSDGLPYPVETVAYIDALGRLNTALAQMADAVAESVCGILVPVKGAEYF